MDETVPRDPLKIRKSAFGRTSLFVPSNSVLIREVQCMGGVSRFHNASVFHMHKMETQKDVCCWHCCESFENEPYKLPRLYDPVEKIYHVYGHFCSPNCAKAHILETTSFDKGQHLNVFTRMMRDIYDVKESITESPPRIALQKFGGPFDIKTFRSMKNNCIIRKPPFVSYCMVVEEKLPTSSISENFDISSFKKADDEENDISQPQTEAMFDKFLKNKKESPPETMDVVKPSVGRKRKETGATSSNINTLARYAKKQNQPEVSS